MEPAQHVECPREGRALGEGEDTLFMEWRKADSCDKCRRECLNRKHMMNHMENESDQEYILYEIQQPPLFGGLNIFILVWKPG